MTDPLHVYIGFDAIDHLAFLVCVRSLLKNTIVPVAIHPLRDCEAKGMGIYWRSHMVAASGQKFDLRHVEAHSTEFTYLRFLTPIVHRHMGRKGWCLFLDADMLWRADVKDLFALAQDQYAVMVVKHVHLPPEKTKIVGVVQTHFERKNWASVMLFNSDSCRIETRDVSEASKMYLHQFQWLDDSLIGGLPEAWNWLDGWSGREIEPKIVHFTRGTPDMPDMPAMAYQDEYWSYVDAADRAALSV